MVSLKHASWGLARKLMRSDWDADHIFTGTPGKWLRIGNSGLLEEVDPPTSDASDPGDLTLIFDNRLI